MGIFSLVGVVSAADPSVIRVSPTSQTVNASTAFMVTVECLPGQPVKAFELKVRFNPTLLQATSVAQGGFFADYDTTFFNPGVIDNVAGTIINVYDLIVGPGNVTTPGSFLTINFTARSISGTSSVSLFDVRATNETDYLPITVSSASVTIVGGSSPPPPPNPPPPSGENMPPFPPLKPVGPTLLELGTSYMYRSAAVDPDGDLVRLRFDWGDGILSDWTSFVESNTTVSSWHNWETVSNYSIRVIAQDTNGSNSSWSEPLLVWISLEEQGLPPVGVFQLPIDAGVNQSLVFDASGSYDPDGAIVSYDWEFGDGAIGAGQVVTHAYQSPGMYTVTLTVTDTTNLTSSTSQTLTITTGASLSTDSYPLLIFSLFFIVTIIVLCVLLFYRYRTQGVFLQKHSTQNKGKGTSLTSATTSFQEKLAQHKRRTEYGIAEAVSPQTSGGTPKGAVAEMSLGAASIQKQIQQSKRRLAQINRNVADIDLVLDDLFAEMHRRKQAPQTNTILDAYSDLIVGQVEKDAAAPLPPLSIKQVEELVNRRVHALVAEKVDKM